MPVHYEKKHHASALWKKTFKLLFIPWWGKIEKMEDGWERFLQLCGADKMQKSKKEDAIVSDKLKDHPTQQKQAIVPFQTD